MKLPRGISIKKNQLNNSFQLSFTDQNGRRCRPILAIEPTVSNINVAKKKLDKAKAAVTLGTFIYEEHFPLSKVNNTSKKTYTILDLCEDYIERCCEKNLSPSTLDGYRKCCNSFKSIHKLDVTKLDFEIVINWIESQKTKPKTIRNRISFLRNAIDRALVKKVIDVNPLRLLNINPYLAIDNQLENDLIDPYLPAEIDALVSYAEEYYKNKIRLWFNTGLRSGEIVDLRWKHVDFDLEVLKVEQAAYNRITKSTKTYETRFVPLNDEALEALQQQKQLSDKTDPDDHIFLNKQGKPWLQDSFRKHQWKSLLKKAGVAYRYPYQLRHSYATKHISLGENLWRVAKWLGHTGPQMLYKHYGRHIEEYELLEKLRKKKANKL